MRKCIALIIAQPDRGYQSELINGITKAAYEADMNVAVFCTLLQSGGTPPYQAGEFNIFDLIHYDQFEGFIYAYDTIQLEESDQLLQTIKEKCKVPVVTVDTELDCFPSIFCDDNAPISSMIHHLAAKHGCKDIAFMTGPKEHEHSISRLNSYLNAMKENQLPVLEDRIYYGDFWYNEGENVVTSLMNSRHGMPQAIACASDRMAYSVYNSLIQHGYHVPKDIIVTGLDEGGERFRFISSYGRNVSVVGSEAVKMILDMKNGVKYENRKYLKSSSSPFRIAQTCGCLDHFVFNNSNAMYIDEENGFFSVYNDMADTLSASKDITDMLWSVNWYTHFIPNMHSFHVCLNDNWQNLTHENVDEQISHGFTPRINLALSRVGETATVDLNRYFPVEEMFPGLWEEENAPQIFFFNSLHFSDKCFGYAVLSLGHLSLSYDPIYTFWLRNLNDTIESQFRLYSVRYLYSKMRENAITDLMTGLYNRNGFNLMEQGIAARLAEEKCQILIFMADLNGLKYINDTFGHDNGDSIIKVSSSSFGACTPEGTITEHNFRMGGDEYTKICLGHYTEHAARDCIKAVTSLLDHYNQTMNKPYPIYLSMGYAMADYSNIKSIDDLMIDADMEMYKHKLLLKRESGFNPGRN